MKTIDIVLVVIILALIGLCIFHLAYKKKRCACGMCEGCIKAGRCPNFPSELKGDDER